MRNDTRPRDAPCVGFLVDDLDAACVVDMAVRVDHGVDGAVVPTPDCGKGLGGCVRFGRIDKDKSGRRADDGDGTTQVGRVDGDDVFRDGRDSTIGDGLRPLFDLRCAVPEPLEKLVLLHRTHPRSHAPAR